MTAALGRGQDQERNVGKGKESTYSDERLNPEGDVQLEQEVIRCAITMGGRYVCCLVVVEWRGMENGPSWRTGAMLLNLL